MQACHEPPIGQIGDEPLRRSWLPFGSIAGISWPPLQACSLSSAVVPFGGRGRRLSHLPPSTLDSGEPDRIGLTTRRHQRKRIEPMGPVGSKQARLSVFRAADHFRYRLWGECRVCIVDCNGRCRSFFFSLSLPVFKQQHGRTERVWFSSCGHPARGEGLTFIDR